jgi:hypothetical protein
MPSSYTAAPRAATSPALHNPRHDRPPARDRHRRRRRAEQIVRGLRAQQPAILLTQPEVLGPFSADPGGWRFLRVKLRIWPGQHAFVENALRQRLLAALRGRDPDYADWMISVSCRVAG